MGMMSYRQRVVALLGAAPSIPTDYLAYYTMEDVVGSALGDETGNFDGTITDTGDITQVARGSGKALDFSPTASSDTDRVDIGDIDLNGDFTVAMKLYVGSAMNENASMVVQKGDPTPTNADNKSPFWIQFDDRTGISRTMQLRLQMGNGSAVLGLAVDNSVPALDTYYTFFVGVEGTTMRMYRETTSIGTTAFTGTRQTNNEAIRLGGYYRTTASFPHTGKIGPIAFYDYWLDSGERQSWIDLA